MLATNFEENSHFRNGTNIVNTSQVSMFRPMVGNVDFIFLLIPLKKSNQLHE